MGTEEANGQVHRLVANQAFVADLHPHRVEVHDRVDLLERARLPLADLEPNATYPLQDICQVANSEGLMRYREKLPS